MPRTCSEQKPDMIHVPTMLLVGATCRNAGKTTFACEIIRRFRNRTITGIKVTAEEARTDTCPLGGRPIDASTSLRGDYSITEETRTDGNKDTQRLLAAGANRVLWLRAIQSKLEDGARALLALCGPEQPLVCESNSLRQVVVPGLFFMVERPYTKAPKPSALHVLPHADAVIYSDGKRFEFDFNRIKLGRNGWQLDGTPLEPTARNGTL